MPLPTFLLLIMAITLAAGATLWAAFAIGIPAPVICLGVLCCAGVARLMERVE